MQPTTEMKLTQSEVLILRRALKTHHNKLRRAIDRSIKTGKGQYASDAMECSDIAALFHRLSDAEFKKGAE